MYCRNCGKQIPDNSKFCPECGAAQVIFEEHQEAPHAEYTETRTIDSRATGIIAYLTWIGFFVALVFGDRGAYAKSQLNQALVLNLFAMLGAIPILGWIWDIFVFIAWLMCFIAACNGQFREAPLLGRIHMLD
jgi:uncharacterized membrane protein